MGADLHSVTFFQNPVKWMAMPGKWGCVFPFLRLFIPDGEFENRSLLFFQSRTRRYDFNSALIFTVTASISFHVGVTSNVDLFSSNAFKYDFAAEATQFIARKFRRIAAIR